MSTMLDDTKFVRFKCDTTLFDSKNKEWKIGKYSLVAYRRVIQHGTPFVCIYLGEYTIYFTDFNIEDYVEPLEGAEKKLADIFVNAKEEIDKAAESFNPVPATKEQKERLEKLCEGLVKYEPTPIEKMSDNELCRKLDIARRNIEKWQKREKDIQRERSRRYCYRKSLEDTEW